MALSLRPEHLKRYKDVATLLVKHGRHDLATYMATADLDIADDLQAEAGVEGAPEQLARDLEALGPSFIKLGQLLSTRSDLLPPPYLEALTRLQDRVEPFPFADVEEIVTTELGVRMSKAFSDFDAVPVAAASLGQVHHARLRDGREVAVKVQRPGIRQVILNDLDAFAEIAGVLDKHTDAGRRYAFQDMLEQFRKSLLRELDYRREALNLRTLGRNLADYPRLVVPQPIDDYTTSRVLTMDYVRGTKVTELSPLARLDESFNGRQLAEDLCRAYLDQILVDGFFHADPHPGNILITEDHRLALIDLGMVARLEPRMQEQLLKLVLAVVDGRGYEAARIAMEIGTVLEDFEEDRYLREVGDLVAGYQDMGTERAKVGRTVLGLSRKAAETGVRPAPELALLGKALLHLDEVARTLEPDLDPNGIVRRHSDTLLRKQMMRRLSPAAIFSSALEMQELVRQLPQRVNRVFDNLAENRLSIRVDAFDEARLMDNLQKIANRIALGLVLAALIVGAALMMQVRTRFTLFGYPGLAILLFLLAAACGFALAVSILVNDDWRVWRNRPPR